MMLIVDTTYDDKQNKTKRHPKTDVKSFNNEANSPPTVVVRSKTKSTPDGTKKLRIQ